MKKRLVLYDRKGNVLRVLPWIKAQAFWAVFRKDVKKLEIVTSLNSFKKDKISFETLAQVSGDQLLQKPLKVGNFGTLELVESRDISPTIDREVIRKPSSHRKAIFFQSSFTFLLAFFSIMFLFQMRFPRLSERKRKGKLSGLFVKN